MNVLRGVTNALRGGVVLAWPSMHNHQSRTSRNAFLSMMSTRASSTAATAIDPAGAVDVSHVHEDILAMYPELVEWRHDFHMNPELGFEEVRTSGLVAERLASFGLDVTTGVGRTGVVGTLVGTMEGDSAASAIQSIGLRADMDALPIEEQNKFSHKSTIAGKAHLCGHDMHTTILLGTARHLASQRHTFRGSVNFIFQPAEEGQGGASAMIKDGLFERFPCDEVYGLHNWPMLPNGNINVSAGPIMASADEFEIEIRGRGGHAAMPHLTDDSLLIGVRIVDSLQSIVSRQVNPLEPAVLSITSFHSSGSACNVIYESTKIKGTVRTFNDDVREDILKRVEKVVKHTVEALGSDDSTYKLKFYNGSYPVTVNSVEQAAYAKQAAVATVGAERVTDDAEITMGAEDFSFMLKERPGCYVWVGGGYGKPMCHHPEYDADDQIMPLGVQFFSNIVKRRLGSGST